MDNILDHVVVQGQRYDIVSPTAFGDYIETIGSACINPDGYAKGSTFLARLGNEQFYYEATAAITQGSAILEGTNCKKTTVTGREAELALEIQDLDEHVDSLNEALSNEVTTRAALGAHNLLSNNAVSQVIDGIEFTVNSNGSVTLNTVGTRTTFTTFTLSTPNLPSNDYIVSGCPSGGSPESYYLNFKVNGSWSGNQDYGSGKEVTGIINEVGISVTATYSPSNVTFYPMIRLASDSDSTYQPYAMTNRELTDELIDILNVDSLIVNEETNASNAANTWFYTGKSFTLSQKSLVCVNCSYDSSAVLGIIVSASNSLLAHAAYINESDVKSSRTITCYLNAGTYYIWAKLFDANKTTRVNVTKLIEFNN